MKAKKIGIIGKKLGMTQIFSEEKMMGVTVIDFSDMQTLGKRTLEKDGYNAEILGYNFDKTGKARYTREIRIEQPLSYENDEYLNILEGVKDVDVVGVMKGRGFAGVMKRHGFHGGPAAHGAKHWHRRPGSIGGHTYPAKVWKGQKMPGHYGNTQICVLNQKLVALDKENKLLFIRGAVPGARNSYVMVRDSIKG
jgi:large subunit ribosomal protein L3